MSNNELNATTTGGIEKPICVQRRRNEQFKKLDKIGSRSIGKYGDDDSEMLNEEEIDTNKK